MGIYLYDYSTQRRHGFNRYLTEILMLNPVPLFVKFLRASFLLTALCGL